MRPACLLDFGAQLGAKLRQLGFKVGSHGPKIRFLRDFVAYREGVPHRIDLRMILELFLYSFFYDFYMVVYVFI